MGMITLSLTGKLCHRQHVICMKWQDYRTVCGILKQHTCRPFSRCTMKAAISMQSLQRSSSTSMHSKAAFRNSSPSSILCLNGPRSTSLQSIANFAHMSLVNLAAKAAHRLHLGSRLSFLWQHTSKTYHKSLLCMFASPILHTSHACSKVISSC